MSYPDPVYIGEGGEVTAWVRGGDSEPDLGIPPFVTVDYLARGQSTEGVFGLYRWNMGPRAGGPEPHFHRTISESFFILSGDVRVHDGNDWVDARGGDFVHVPPGGIHGFRNEADAPASMLLLFTPGAPREEYFETLFSGGTADMTDEEKAAFYQRHDNHFV